MSVAVAVLVCKGNIKWNINMQNMVRSAGNKLLILIEPGVYGLSAFNSAGNKQMYVEIEVYTLHILHKYSIV